MSALFRWSYLNEVTSCGWNSTVGRYVNTTWYKIFKGQNLCIYITSLALTGKSAMIVALHRICWKMLTDQKINCKNWLNILYCTVQQCFAWCIEYEIVNNGIYMARKQVTYQFNHALAYCKIIWFLCNACKPLHVTWYALKCFYMLVAYID